MSQQKRLNDYSPIAELPPAQRRDYLGCVAGGYSIRAWAEEIDREPGTVGHNVSAAKRTLGERVGDESNRT